MNACISYIMAQKVSKNTRGLVDLPTKLFRSIFTYLDAADIYNLGRAGNKRLNQIAGEIAGAIGK